MTNKVLINTDDVDLEKLKAKMASKDVAKIADKTGFSAPYIYKILNPNNERRNDTIIKAAIELIDERSSASVNEGTAKSILNN